MYRKIQDFIEDWKAESASTIKVFSNISDKAKGKKRGEHIRSLERLAWHITQTLTEMPSRAGIISSDFLDNQPIPLDMKGIISIYERYSGELSKLVAEKWTDAGLTEKIDVYGQPWERRKVLSVLVLHQAHHRGQMTTLMRLEGLKVPGVYGPSKEEWAQFGMSAME
jgi:uncharacterized damage-inducible protein DinB